MLLLEETSRIVKDVAIAAMIVIEVKKTHLVIADVAEVVIPTVQVQQTGSPIKFIILPLYAEIRLAVQPLGVFRQVIAMMPLKKVRLASTKAATFLLDFGSLFNYTFLASIFFCLIVEDVR